MFIHFVCCIFFVFIEMFANVTYKIRFCYVVMYNFMYCILFEELVFPFLISFSRDMFYF